ncbi:hypothetical protein COT65_02150 [Candidatus Shapirobacteria bacterium CG09_land_8_20_14_0_10_47_13]|uniref:Glycosyltransferase RgtA/B/C/D-like domain-containing protein n=1 Tax=Candidatus Shapirobacteria bacterium CG09_land_8_20_14_0_10_47_13 TaxID=1974481 RepID=A0A2H0WMD9_9BACT|nr:MAG: hypothetical protein COT65_02150 [Candidatus Shapirobacteria bacterium CG09_land_8_20_14_0_10_47_13]
MSKKTELIILLAILAIAAFLRFYQISGYMTFLGDEGRDVLVVKRMIVDHKFTLLGPTASVGGFFLGPIYYYFMLPFLWLFKLDPVGPAVMVALFGLATVFLVYKVGKDFFNAGVGLLAAFFYTISPVVIYYSRTSWNPNLMPFFALLIIWLTWKTVVEKRPIFLPLIGFFFGILIQLHYLATFLMVVVALFLVIYGRRLIHLKHWLGGVAGFAVGWSPFLLFELRHGFPNLRTLYRFILFGEETGFNLKTFFFNLTEVPIRVFGTLLVNNSRPLGLLLLAGSLWVLFSKRLTLKLMAIWLGVGVFLFGFYQKGIYDYYFVFMFPLPFLLTALLITRVSQFPRGKFLATLIFSALLLINVKNVPIWRGPNRQAEQAQKVARLIFDQAGGQPFNFALITGHNSDHAYRYFLEIWGNPPITVENFANDPERKTVTDQLFVVCEILPCSPLGHPLWEIAGFGRAEIEQDWLVSVVRVYKLKHWQGNEKP